MSNLALKTAYLENYVSEEAIAAAQGQVSAIHADIAARKLPGSEFLGWIDLPSAIDPALVDDIAAEAKRLQGLGEVCVTIGIGGSYLGAKAATDFVGQTSNMQVVFAGETIASDSFQAVLDLVANKDFVVNIISKSGTTTEPAIAFRIFRKILEERYGKDGAKERIVATTDASQGALRQLADQEGYKTYIIPDDVGGRFSVLTPVGLLPIAVAGIDIHELLAGAARMKKSTDDADLSKNLAYRYAVIRNALYAQGKVIEVTTSFQPCIVYVAEWCKQLFGESEGKDQKGIFPASMIFTTDLHSLGQSMQEGLRNLFETFVMVKKSNTQILVEADEANLDGLNYLAGKSLDDINFEAYRATSLAHYDGGVPSMTIEVPDRSAGSLGELFYFYERTVIMSGYLLGVNPFNQPGVEAYKVNMFTLLSKPGFEDKTEDMNKRVKL